jgi:hypothetical protein
MNTWALTTVARYKAFAGITAATYDTKIAIIIDVATDFIEKFCDRRFLETTYTNEVYDGHGSRQLLLKNYPINTRNAFQLDERDTPMNVSQWSSVDTDLYHIDYLAGLLELIDMKFSEYPRHYQVTYTAGYEFDNTTPGATLESLGIGDLEFACWQIVSNIFKNTGSQTGIDSESIGNYSVSYGQYYLLDPEVKMILNKYKRPHLM